MNDKEIQKVISNKHNITISNKSTEFFRYTKRETLNRYLNYK
jgi:hypothetical protein